MAASAITVTDLDNSAPPDLSDILGAADLANGMYLANNGKPILICANASGSPITLTVAATYSRDGLDLEDLVVTVADGETLFVGPFNSNTFEDASGNIGITVSDDTSVTIGAIRA